MEDKELNCTKSLKSQYNRMKQDREPFLYKATEAAKYTLPSLISLDTTSPVKLLKSPNQSIGADGINNLSSKITLTMLPPNQPFFKFSMDSMSLKFQAKQAGKDAAKYEEDVNKGLSKTETMLVDYCEQTGDRVCLGEAQKHLLVTGNVLLVDDPTDGLKMYPLNRFVVKRDYCGNVLKAICTETVGYDLLPESVQEQILEQLKIDEKKDDIPDIDEKEFTLYTGFRRTSKSWIVTQEVEGFPLEDVKGKYPIDVCPFMALRYTRIDGESYGRGLIEEYIGDISYLDTLALAIKQSSLAASKFIMLVNPNGITKVKNLANTKNGGFAQGRVEDVRALQAEKYNDLQTARLEKESIEKRLYRIFLMAQAVQRQAERVSATEIQFMVRDLEEALGNYYSILSREFQYSYVKIKFFHLRKSKGSELPDLIKSDSVKLTVTTGLEALGRGSDLNKLTIFLDTMSKLAPMAQAIGAKTDSIANQVAASLNLDISGFMYTEEEKQAQMEAAQKQELLKTAAPAAVTQMGNLEKVKLEKEGEPING